MNWNNYISKTAQELPASGIRKIWEMALSMDNVLSLGVGEPDYAPPQKVLDAAIKSLKIKKQVIPVTPAYYRFSRPFENGTASAMALTIQKTK